MNTSLTPRATLGRDLQLDEVTLSRSAKMRGGMRTAYANDTWVGETVLIDDGNLISPWRLAISATDSLGSMLDAVPGRYSYTAG